MNKINTVFSINKNNIYLICSALLFAVSQNALAAYEAFPKNEGPYVSGNASETLPWSGENFESHQDSTILECSNSKYLVAHFDVTSGCLSTKYEQRWQTVWDDNEIPKGMLKKLDDEYNLPSQNGLHLGIDKKLASAQSEQIESELKRGWTDDSVFRAVAIGRAADGREIKWTEQSTQYRGFVEQWHNDGDIPNWSGLHVFARYRTSDDLYVASLRYDGLVTIKRKWKGKYTTLAYGKLNNDYKTYLDDNGKLKSKQWYLLNFSVVGKTLKFYVDGELVVQADDGTFSWGTTGMRIDNATTYIDDWKLQY